MVSKLKHYYFKQLNTLFLFLLVVLPIYLEVITYSNNENVITLTFFNDHYPQIVFPSEKKLLFYYYVPKIL